MNPLVIKWEALVTLLHSLMTYLQRLLHMGNLGFNSLEKNRIWRSTFKEWRKSTLVCNHSLYLPVLYGKKERSIESES